MSYKPTYFNIHLMENSSFPLIIFDNSIDSNAYLAVFGNNFDLNGLGNITFVAETKNDWIWWPNPSKVGLFDHLNSSEDPINAWKG